MQRRMVEVGTNETRASGELEAAFEPALCRGENVAGFNIAAAAVQGPGHIREGKPCDDRFSWQADAGRICAVVCDGAGSARLGRVGADVASRLLSSSVLRAMCEADLSIESARVAILAAIEDLRGELLSRHAGASISDFHATVVGAIWDKAAGILFHIGDGVAAALSDPMGQGEPDLWTDAQISEPENGQYQDQTYFFTMDPIRLRMLSSSQPIAIVLMTDGGSSIAYTDNIRKLEGGFFGPIAKYWARDADSAKMAEQLAKVMRTAEADEKSDDDKCILLAVSELTLDAIKIGA